MTSPEQRYSHTRSVENWRQNASEEYTKTINQNIFNSESFLITLLIHALILVCAHKAEFAAVHEVPAFTTQDLFSGRRDDDLLNTLTTTGLLAIRVPAQSGNGAIRSGKSVLDGLCQCREKIGEIQGGESTLLADRRTTRSTIATTIWR